MKNNHSPDGSALFSGTCLSLQAAPKALPERSGIQSSHLKGGRSYFEWGEKLDKPIYGCVVVFTRSGGDHVGFVLGQAEKGN